MRKLAIAALLLTTAALPAQALNTNDILSLIGMPLAVAAVSNLAGVPQDQLSNVIATLNNANVPPAQFVQVVRYVPVALVEQQPPQEQTFSQWLDTQTSQGVTGPELVTSIDNRLATTYDVQPVIEPNQVVYVDENYIPQTVITRLQPLNANPLALAMMPLAVAAVSNLTGIPQDQLGDLVTTLNQANVPPTQFVEVVQYAPVALVAQTPQQPAFVDFVQTQAQQGITGPALVTVIAQRLPSYGVQLRTQRSAPIVITDERDFPPAVREHIRVMAERNPHGGPPGQIKKQLGLQTGAEVVHGMKPGRQFEQRQVVAVPPPQRVVVREEHGHGNGRGHGRGGDHGNKQEQRVQALPPMTSAAPPVPVQAPVVRPMPGPPGGMPPGQAKKEGGEGHGHGKGHGKD